MRAELKALDSVDVDLRSYVPEDEAFCISITAHIGAVGESGVDAFRFDVCSPQWLEAALQTDAVISGRHTLFMDGFRLGALEAYVVKRVRQAEGPDWPSVAEKLSRWAYWEFEDYQEP
jgi:hypothetical protein